MFFTKLFKSFFKLDEIEQVKVALNIERSTTRFLFITKLKIYQVFLKAIF